MRISRFWMVAMVAMLCICANSAFAKSVHVKAVSSGNYFGGVFKASDEKFEAVYHIDTDKGVVSLVKLMVSDREGRQKEGDVYEIVNILESKGLSGLLVPKERVGEEIITCVRDELVGASEILIIGESFYEFCKSANSKIYLESGEILK